MTSSLVRRREPIDEVQDGLEAAAEDARLRLSLTKFAGIVDPQGDSGWRVTLVKPGTGPAQTAGRRHRALLARNA